MDISVVVATLNGRDALAACLDALASVAPSTERIVVNGPSADGTSGMVRERDDVHVLLELADRNVNVARNAGTAAATGDVVAYVDERTVVSAGWLEALEAALVGSAVVTGPVRRPLPVGTETSRPERSTFCGLDVSFFDGANVAFARRVIEALDGFDEYLEVGGARDAAHRLSALDVDVAWSEDLLATREATGPEPIDGDAPSRKFRALSYRLAKNYGPSPGVLRRVVGSARSDGTSEFGGVLSGETPVSTWIGRGAGVASGGIRGTVDGLRARLTDRRPARNPNGVTSRSDRVVKRYDLE